MPRFPRPRSSGAFFVGGLPLSRKTFYLDLLERVAWSFIGGFAAAWIVIGEFSDEALQIGLTAGAVSVAKGLVVNQLPWTADNSASTLPAEVDPPAGK